MTHVSHFYTTGSSSRVVLVLSISVVEGLKPLTRRSAPPPRARVPGARARRSLLAVDPGGACGRGRELHLAHRLRLRSPLAAARPAAYPPKYERRMTQPPMHPRWVVGVPATPGAPPARGVGVGAGGLARNGRVCLIHG